MRASLAVAAAFVLLSSFAGCFGLGGDADDRPVEEIAAVESRPLTSFLHDVTVKDPSLNVASAVIEHWRILVREDIHLDAWTARPTHEPKVPLVLEVTPYYGGGSPLTNQCPGLIPTSHCFGAWGEELVAHGYAVGLVSVRGTGNSEGCFTQAGPQEARDTATAIEYFAAQPWSNGHVALMGVSYPGTTPMDVWVEAPEHLSAVVPIEGITDLYKYSFVNGIPIIYGFNNYYWAIVGLGPAGLEGGNQVYDPASALYAVRGEGCTDQADVQRAGAQGIAEGNKDAYWQLRDFTAELRADWDKPRAPIFFIQGFQDWNVKPHNMEQWVEAVQETGVPFKAWLGQWEHNWPDGTLSQGASHCDGMRNDTCRYDWWNATLIAWFDQWLKDVDTGIMDAPPVQIQSDNMLWRNEPYWPPEDTQWLRFNLHADGTMGEGEGSGSAHFFDQGGRPPDHDALRQEPDRAAWVSEPLDRDVYLAGFPRFEGNVTATGQRASLLFTLSKIVDDNETDINFGGLSLNHAKDLTQGAASIANVKQHVLFDFFPQDNFIPRGGRLVLTASGYAINGTASFQPVSDGSDIRMDLAGAHFDVPVDPSIFLETPQPFLPPREDS